MPYKLSSVLFGHSMDVRALAITSDNCIVSTSRDKTAKLWKPNGFNCGYTEEITLRGHSNFVSCVCVLPPSNIFPEGLILTGGCDSNICAYQPLTGSNPLFILQGHKENVCCLNPGVGPGFVLSSSWDKTAKIWSTKDEKCTLTLTGHESSVWSVIQLSSGFIITGSADKTIRVYVPDGAYQKTLTGHTDCVRSLAGIDDKTFYSCGNDATIRKWNAQTGESLGILYGHPHYIYSISVLGDLMVTGGEDKAVRVWHGEEPEPITLPAQSVWAVACLPNSDIVTGSNDGVVRIFSADPSRQADEAQQAEFAKDVSAFSQTTEQEIGGVKVSDLPGKEALYEPGKSEGQTKLVREGASVTCYSWSSAENQWNKIGDVMGAQGQAGKQLHNGKEYDFVFNVDIEDGKPPLKLPYNQGEDPWMAAQEFIHRHNLSQQFLEQVANFIVTNSKDAEKPVTQGNPQFCDPFTGGARYIPGGSTNGVASGVDPFTGGTRYVPATSSASSFTCSTDSRGSAQKVTYFPQTSYLRFDQANLKAIHEKLEEFNKKTGDGLYKLDKSALESIMKICNINSPATEENIVCLKKLLDWPDDIVFPVLDITRLALRNKCVNTALCSGPASTEFINLIRKYLGREVSPANQMLALRIASNMLSHPPGENLVFEQRHFLLSVVRQLAGPSASKNLQIALSTLLLNLSIVSVRRKDEHSEGENVATISLILPVLSDPEAMFRGLVAVGNIIHHQNSLKEQLAPETITRLRSTQTSSSDKLQAKVAACSSQILALVDGR